jgi:hypothetical protein
MADGEVQNLGEGGNAQRVEINSDAPPPPSGPQRPDNVPEKFWDAEKGTVNTEALLKSYTELEQKASKPADPPKPADSADPAAAAAAKAGLDMASLESEFAAAGKLSDESLGKLQAAGISKEMLDTYIAGRQALVAQQEAEVFGIAGDKAGFEAMTNWARSNLTEAEAAEYNKLVESSDFSVVKAAVENLHTKYKAATGSTGTSYEGGGADNSGDVYASTEEYLRDAGDPRYAKDPAFRDKVIAKWVRSGTYQGARAY